MDIMTAAVQSAPGAAATKVYVTLNGTAAELQALMGKMEAALYGTPQVLEVNTASGVSMRIVVDRLGDAPMKQ
jgi:hypothetical protein